ncbi:hypothetical protein [Methylocaldum sp. RMAD-M]|uniref:hypothetical protein n=1 Tax=Methylocaldum sp. RMAD-M TaxID=2806557 RepID=UPI00111C597D|nr:hypothetical protein [Methylocaldum sp. RMAD-M]MBP1151438.1 hypothetical protein [Methylocaldum sp. RMAD-M]
MLEHFPVWCATQAAVGRESLPDVFVGKGLPTYNHICACIQGVCRVPNSHRYAAAKNALGLIHTAALDRVLVDVVGRESLPDVFAGKGLPTYNHICACIQGAEFPIHTAMLRRKTLSA